MYCKYCHKKITNDSLFCAHCGHSTKSTYRLWLPPNMTLSNKKVEIIQMDISELIKQKKELTHTINLINESIQDTNKQRLLKEIIKLEKDKEKLLNSTQRLSDEVNRLSFQKEMLEIEINEIKNKKSTISTSNCDTSFSIEYFDNIPSGLDFVDTLVLGCTHYPLLRSTIKRLMGEDVTLINPAYETAIELKALLEKEDLICCPGVCQPEEKYQFYVSDLAEKFTNFASSILPRQVKETKKIDIENY